MFQLTMFPAEDGDCLLLSWGEAPPYRHIVIDGGRKSAYNFLKPQLEKIRDAGEEVEVLVLTHIDADHIEGLLKLANDETLPVQPKEVWFNGFDQLARLPTMGPGQGDEYTAKLRTLKWPWNPITDGEAITIEALPDPFEIAGLRLQILSPNEEKLAALAARWAQWRSEQAAKEERARLKTEAGDVEVMGRKPMPSPLVIGKLIQPTPTDGEPPNGSSIAFIAEWNGRRMLLTGDAHPELLQAQIERIKGPEVERLPIDLFKVSHHGSIGNTTKGLVEAIDCRCFAISTSGSRHGHPDPEAIARLLHFSPRGAKTLVFTHRTPRTAPWDNRSLQDKYGYKCRYAAAKTPISIDLDG